MHDPEKSDSGRVAAKPTNKAGRPAAEPVEPRPGAKGNADQQSTHRTQSRVRVTQALDRVREAAKQRKKGQFTTLLHQTNADTLRTAFYALKRKAAPGVDGITWHDYEADLEPKIEELHGRVHRGAYRPQLSAPDVHIDGRWEAAAACDRRPGRQDRPGRNRHGAQCCLRKRLPRLLVRVPTRARATRCAGRAIDGDQDTEGELDT